MPVLIDELTANELRAFFSELADYERIKRLHDEIALVIIEPFYRFVGDYTSVLLRF